MTGLVGFGLYLWLLTLLFVQIWKSLGTRSFLAEALPLVALGGVLISSWYLFMPIFGHFPSAEVFFGCLAYWTLQVFALHQSETTAPPAPAQPNVTYDETSMKVTWANAAAEAHEKVSSSAGVLPSTSFGVPTPRIATHVYEVAPPAASSGSNATAESRLPATAVETRLTKTPVTEAEFVDARIAWGVERCYTVRAVWTYGEMSLESDAAPPRCTTPIDTFPPAAPTGLTPIPSEGAITLIWNPNTESDVAGYIVLRAPGPKGALAPVTPAPIQLTTFRDMVPRGRGSLTR